MIMIGLARIGNEPVVRYTADNKQVLDLSLAVNYGRKGQDGKQPTQWIKGTLWGERAGKLAPYLQKGNQVMVQLKDIHNETYTKKDNSQNVSMKATIADVQLISGAATEQPEQHHLPKQTAPSFDELSDDMPF